MQDLKDQNDYVDLFFNERWTNYALDKSDEIPDLLLELEKETHQKILQPRMMSSPLPVSYTHLTLPTINLV